MKLHNFLSESQQSPPTCVVYQHETLIINAFMNSEWNMLQLIINMSYFLFPPNESLKFDFFGIY